MRLVTLIEGGNATPHQLDDIIAAVRYVLEPHDVKVTQDRSAHEWVEVHMVHAGEKNSMSFTVKDGTLRLANVYMPTGLRNKGLMIAILKRIHEQVEGLNGNCRVLVPMNMAGWHKIVTSAGFKFVRPVYKGFDEVGEE